MCKSTWSKQDHRKYTLEIKMQSNEREQETIYIPFLCAAKAVGELVAMCFTSTSKRTGLVATLSCGRIICGLLYKVRALCSIWGQCNLEAGSVALTTLSDPTTVFHHFFLPNPASNFPLHPQFHLSPCRYPEWRVSTFTHFLKSWFHDM